MATTEERKSSTCSLRGKPLHSTAQQLVKNVIDYFIKEKCNGGPLVSINAVKGRASAALGIDGRTVARYAKTPPCGYLKTPGKKRPRRKPITDIDDKTGNAIRRLVYDKYADGTHCTTREILHLIAERGIEFHGQKSSLHKILKTLGFYWAKTDNRRLLVESAEVAAARARYLRTLRENRQSSNPRPVVYLDEMWIFVNTTRKREWNDNLSRSCHDHPAPDGARFVVLHAGWVEAWISTAGLHVRAKSKNGDHHDNLNDEDFKLWVTTQLMPNLPPNAIVVMDHAPYRSVQEDRAPTQSARKAEIRAWLDRHNIAPPDKPFKCELLTLVAAHQHLHKRYVIDDLLLQGGLSVLRLPPYHCDLNPIELVWEQAKEYYDSHENGFGTGGANSRSCSTDIWREGLESVTADRWEACVKRVEQLEDEYWHKDGVIDERVEPLTMAISDATESSSDLESMDDDVNSAGDDDGDDDDLDAPLEL